MNVPSPTPDGSQPIQAAVESFIIAHLLQGTTVEAIDHSEKLLTGAIIDSHGLLQLVDFLEHTYDIVTQPRDLTPETFESIASIAAYVRRLRDGATGCEETGGG